MAHSCDTCPPQPWKVGPWSQGALCADVHCRYLKKIHLGGPDKRSLEEGRSNRKNYPLPVCRCTWTDDFLQLLFCYCRMSNYFSWTLWMGDDLFSAGLSTKTSSTTSCGKLLEKITTHLWVRLTIRDPVPSLADLFHLSLVEVNQAIKAWSF